MVINFLYKVQVGGQAIRKNAFFTNSGGLTTTNKRFEFNVIQLKLERHLETQSYIYTKSNGSGLATDS